MIDASDRQVMFVVSSPFSDSGVSTLAGRYAKLAEALGWRIGIVAPKGLGHAENPGAVLMSHRDLYSTTADHLAARIPVVVLGLPKELPLAQLAIRSVIGSEYGTVLWERPGFTHTEAGLGLLDTDSLRHAWTLNKSYIGELETMLPQAVVSVAPLTLPRAFFSETPRPRRISGPYGVYLGRFADWKGAPKLAKVWVQEIFPKTGFKLVMIGLGIEPDSPGEIDVVSTARRFPDRIQLVRTMEVAVRVGLLQHASLAVFPGRYEHFPQALVETMAVGTPAVCTDIAGYSPLAQHGRTALVVDTDLNGLESAVTALAADPGLCRSLAARARRLVNEAYSEQAAAEGLAQLLNNLGPAR